MATDLIYDIGIHRGEDSRFYLAKGFDVVGIDANPDMCLTAATALSQFVDDGRLKILNVAISDRTGPVPFFKNCQSEWGTIVERWSDHNRARGCPSDVISVEAVTLAQLVHEHGHAHYMKIDIEGMDLAALHSLAGTSMRPRYISVESAFPREASFANIRAEFAALSALGYQWFKIVAQHEVASQIPPCPAREGEYVSFQFSGGSSGLFGEEAPGEWLSCSEALRTFRRIILKNSPQAQLYRHYRLFLTYAGAMRRLGKNVDLGWYDIHARHADAGS